MTLRVLAIACVAVLSIAAPLPRPASTGSPKFLVQHDFEADSMLAVGASDASSYATAKRSVFEADAMLKVGAGAASSYADTEARSNFEADSMLGVGAEAESSYAT
ncbi:hypothetical protein MMC16_003379 [Acarospora aff. strigata]|nr:hypothetical protein [Acarospora aff. strigata]